MGALLAMIVVLTFAIGLCGLYSGMDIQYGDKGFYCWSAFCLLITGLGGGATLGAVAAALLAGGKTAGLEPFAVLIVSLLSSRALYFNMFSPKADDVEVERKPYEEQIRDLLFRNDPSRLHLVDAELLQYKGREKELLRAYKEEFAPSPVGIRRYDLGRTTGARGGGGLRNHNAESQAPIGTGEYEFGRTRRARKGVGGHSMNDRSYFQKDVKELAREEEQRRVQASLESSIQRILGRKASRR